MQNSREYANVNILQGMNILNSSHMLMDIYLPESTFSMMKYVKYHEYFIISVKR